eukprot:13091651-Alexandrium_andersonii.AAC.1
MTCTRVGQRGMPSRQSCSNSDCHRHAKAGASARRGRLGEREACAAAEQPGQRATTAQQAAGGGGGSQRWAEKPPSIIEVYASSAGRRPVRT